MSDNVSADPPPLGERWVGIEEAASYCRVSVRTFTTYCTDGLMPAGTKPKGRRLWWLPDVHASLATGRAVTAADQAAPSAAQQEADAAIEAGIQAQLAGNRSKPKRRVWR